MGGGVRAEGGNSRRRGQGGPRAWQRGLFFAVFGHPSSVFGCFLLFVFLFRLHLRLRLRLGLGLDLGLGLGLGFRLRLRLRLHLCLGLGLGLGLRLRLCFLFGFFLFSILCFFWSALRVSPAETRLTVCRRLRVLHLCNARSEQFRGILIPAWQGGLFFLITRRAFSQEHEE